MLFISFYIFSFCAPWRCAFGGKPWPTGIMSSPPKPHFVGPKTVPRPRPLGPILGHGSERRYHTRPPQDMTGYQRKSILTRLVLVLILVLLDVIEIQYKKHHSIYIKKQLLAFRQCVAWNMTARTGQDTRQKRRTQEKLSPKNYLKKCAKVFCFFLYSETNISPPDTY